jgi:membrane protein
MTLIWKLLKQAADQWSKHNAPRLGAALSYYTALSLAPLLLAVVALCGLFFGEEAVRGQVYWEIKGVVGSQAADVVQSLLKDAHKPGAGTLASIVGFAVLLSGASGVFVELRDTLNYIWDAPPDTTTGLWGLLRYRFFAFAMVLGIGFLLIVSLVMTALIHALGAFAVRYLSVPEFALETMNFAISFAVTALLFALIYKVIPEVPNTWKDVSVGATFTAILFTVGKFAIGLYLGKAGVGSAYGAAGSLIVLLVWVYYSSQVFLFGAEFTYVYARHHGSPAIPGAVSSKPA